MGKYKKLYLESEGKKREYVAALVKAEDEAAKYRTENDSLLDSPAVLKTETEVLSKELRELREKKKKASAASAKAAPISNMILRSVLHA